MWYLPSSRSRTTTRGPSSCSARSSWSGPDGSTNPPITCPPSNPISTRTRPSSATRHHLRENTMDRLRMHERDLQPEHPAARATVDQFDALPGEMRERSLHVLDLVRDVMHAGSPPGEELPDRRVVAE